MGDDLNDLEQLLNDLGRPKSVAPTKKVRSSVVNLNELELLMTDLADSPAPKKNGHSVIRQQPVQIQQKPVPAKAAPPSSSFDVDDLDSIMNALNGEVEAPRKQPAPAYHEPMHQQPAPVKVLPQKSPAPVAQPLPTSSQRVSTMNDLEALLNDLDDVSSRSSVRASPTPAPMNHAQVHAHSPASAPTNNYHQTNLSSHSNTYQAPPAHTNNNYHQNNLSSHSNTYQSPPLHANNNSNGNHYQALSPLSQHSQAPRPAAGGGMGVGMGMGAKPAPASSFLSNQSNQNSFVAPQQKAFVPKPAASRALNDTAIDDMLVDLQKQLMSSPDPSSPSTNGTCSTCGKVILGEVITALGNRYHPEHFVCGNCQYPLGTSNFYEQDGIAHCEKCYQELLCARCAHCDEPILDRCVTALGKKWHAEHFACVQCQRGFRNGSFFERDGRPFCEDCFTNAFAPKCGGCGQNVTGPTINALGQAWHPEHFVCQYCQKAFTGSFFDFGGKPYCDIHYHQQTGSLCAGCNKAVAGQCIDALGKKWHPEHFVCAFCMEQLMAGSFTENQNKAYCKSCHGKLFG